MSACPCGSGRDLADCCGPVLDGSRAAATPEALMRSRYTAFVRRDAEYLTRSHAAPPPKDPLAFARSLHDITWLDLKVHAAEAGAVADEGFVSFTARTIERDAVVAMSERSRFLREGGTWRYVDGTPTVQRTKLSPNDPCPCGSGTKFKKCHG